MSIPIPDFWRLAVESQLLTPAACQRLEADFSQVKGASLQGNARTLSEWLIANRALSRFQAAVLLAGRPGPFVYGDYRVFDRIGGGHLAGQFRATHAPTGHVVGLVFLGAEANDALVWPTIAAQVAAAARAVDPHLSRTFDLVQAGNYRFIVVEDLAGQTAAEHFVAHGPATAGEACRWAAAAALGLGHLHALGMIHGDVRPTNLWIDLRQQAKLLQVPLGRAADRIAGPIALAGVDAEPRLEQMANYFAPELADGRTPRDTRSDLYAFGSTLYQLISGQPPFAGGTVQTKMARRASESPPLLAKFGVPQPLARLVAILLDRDPEQRNFSAIDVAEALQPFAEAAEPTIAVANADKLPAYEQWLRREVGSRAAAWQPASVQPTPVQPAAIQLAVAQPTVAQPMAVQPPAAQPIAPAAVAGLAAAAWASPPAITPSATSASLRTAPQPAGPPMVAPPTLAPPLAQLAPPVAAPPMVYAPATAPAVATFAAAPRQPSDSGMFFDNLLNAAPDAGQQSSATATLAPPQLAGSNGSLAATEFAVAGGIAGLQPDSEQSVSRPKKTSAANNGGIYIAAAALLLVAGVGVTIYMINRREARRQTASVTPPIVAPLPVVTPPPVVKPPEKDPSKIKDPKDNTPENPPGIATEVVADDGVSLWTAPTKGAPLSLKYVPGGAQAVVAVRPRDLLRQPDAEKIVQSLGPFGEAMLKRLQELTGTDPQYIDQTLASFHENESGPMGVTLVVRFHEKRNAEMLTTLAAGAQPVTVEGGAYSVGPQWAFYFPSGEDGHILVISDVERIKQIVADSEPRQSRELVALLKDTDANRHFTALLLPVYLFADNIPQLPGSLEPLRKQLQWFVGDDPRAVALSVHLSEDFFAEVRLSGMIEKTPQQQAALCQKRLHSSPDELERYLAASNPQPFGRAVLLRFPRMVQALDQYTRSGVENNEAVLRSYLPIVAGHNLLMASELALAERPAGVTTAGNEPKKPQSVAELLKKTISLSFPRDTLEKSMEMLATEMGVKIEIIGPDLQLDGITKNQSFGLDEMNKPASAILQVIMKKANPDGKLIYVIKPKQPGGEEMLFITTRAAAAKRGDKLPPELEIKK